MSHDNCILGFVGSIWDKKTGSYYDTKVGGEPIWPQGINYIPPSCSRCGNPRVLLLQAFAPHFKHGERSVYLFACNSIICCEDPNNWTAVRLVKQKRVDDIDNGRKVSNDDQNEEGSCMDNFNKGKQISWSSDEEEDDDDDDGLLSELSALAIQVQQIRDEPKINTRNNNAKGLPSTQIERTTSSEDSSMKNLSRQVQESTSNPQMLNSFYVEVSVEPRKSKTNETSMDDAGIDQLLEKYQREEQVNADEIAAEGWGAEEEEQISVEKGALETFTQRLERAPQQILRYNFGGQPIWAIHPAPKHTSNCVCSCGSKLVFELQLLGSVLYYLKPDQFLRPDQSEAGLNFSSVAIYSCESDCLEAPILENSETHKIFSQSLLLQQDEW